MKDQGEREGGVGVCIYKYDRIIMQVAQLAAQSVHVYVTSAMMCRLMLMPWGHGVTTGRLQGVPGRATAALTCAVSPIVCDSCPTMWLGRRASDKLLEYSTPPYQLTQP